ncbi:hypothetical protein Tco_0523662 [Tanacetum coccineum]
MSAKKFVFRSNLQQGGKIVAAIDFVKELRVDNQHIKVINLGINLKDDKSELSILVDKSIGAPHVGDRSMMAKKFTKSVGAGGGVGLAAVQIGKELEKETKKGSESGCYSQKVVSGNEGGWDSKKLVNDSEKGAGSGSS